MFHETQMWGEDGVPGLETSRQWSLGLFWNRRRLDRLVQRTVCQWNYYGSRVHRPDGVRFFSCVTDLLLDLDKHQRLMLVARAGLISVPWSEYSDFFSIISLRCLTGAVPARKLLSMPCVCLGPRTCCRHKRPSMTGHLDRLKVR